MQDATALTRFWEIWSLHVELQQRAVATRTDAVYAGLMTWSNGAPVTGPALLKTVVLRVLAAVDAGLPLDQLVRAFVALECALYCTGGSLCTDLLHARAAHAAAVAALARECQHSAAEIRSRGLLRFSEFTSGWKLCIELSQILSYSFVVSQEFPADCYGLRSRPDEVSVWSTLDDGTCSLVSVRTSRSVASSKLSAARSTARFEIKREHYRSAVARDVISEDGNEHTSEKFKLKTLEEHRYATRFQEKRVTAKTWRSALREAHKLIQSGDRVLLADALYLLLEIIWLNPRGCNPAAIYLDSGSIYLTFDHLDEAAKAYRNSLRLDPSNWKAQYNLGVTLARLQDFVEATRQLNRALKSCPSDISEEIATMFEEIDRIQCSKNLRAFNETKKARVFTTHYLESQHITSDTSCKKSGVLNSCSLQEDHTLSHRNGFALNSTTPQLLDVSNEWQGSIASLLHRIHAFARCRNINIEEEMLRLDPTQVSGISIHAFDEIVTRITGTCHALLELPLSRKRANRSAKSKSGGLWQWFEITMASWIDQIFPHLHPTTSHDRANSQLVASLAAHNWLTPIQFAWEARRLPGPEDLSILQLSDRGIFIYECHRVRNCIQNEASRTLQMFFRRRLLNNKRRNNVILVGLPFRCHEVGARQDSFLEDVHTRLAKDTLFDQQVAGEVLRCIEDMVDDIVVGCRREDKGFEDAVRWQDIPVRTEQRQKIISAVGVVQTAVRPPI
ncbi:unnamed protein product [Phytophthora lilii]|uniref:Unnamed protein product n=1 Tax=Phytophthora lilii TaxID=2077276 RepID=A0A9W6TUS2_9STRA|nr:unnamed protein product [Phytophthora lilii]